MPVQHMRSSGQAQHAASPEKNQVTSKSPVGDISVVTLIRTDTTLDHSQKAEKVWLPLLRRSPTEEPRHDHFGCTTRSLKVCKVILFLQMFSLARCCGDQCHFGFTCRGPWIQSTMCPLLEKARWLDLLSAVSEEGGGAWGASRAHCA